MKARRPRAASVASTASALVSVVAVFVFSRMGLPCAASAALPDAQAPRLRPARPTFARRARAES